MDQSGTPRTIFIGDTKTAGSICLILQAALPVAMFARKNPTTLILKGGTNASMAPPYDYWERVFLPILVEKFNVPGGLIHHTITRRGYFPKGGGEVRITTSPLLRPLDPIFMTQRGTISEISIRSYCAGSIPLQVATEMADSAKKILRQKNILVHPRIDIVREANAIGDGSGILIVAKTTTGCLLAGSALGETKKRGHVVGREAAEELIETIEDGGCVDEWLQDQLILFMALAKGKSEILTGSLTLHTQTAIWVAQQLCGAVFEVERAAGDVVMRKDSSSVADAYGKDGRIPGKHLIRCSGIGYVNQQNQEPH
jgi:RNA 3'-terminal phosphate cyclase (ATP)